ncbi:M20 metallopeptidase family protein [Acidaminobacter hydrogenoformans]|uniref:Amidohydrolase n=1 Tax=Acidaminobacter hydrogenoformans DSM 2784 TaxID=1120920 RepID=A0A1G5S6Q5_9FIRM|nr:M20/M25/M40 family metallo-hydrolase [Acidaminobacter hydrogenoformans]SCZ82054.1 amidohydrolase [Acidaminobacter hydrogenoformans DSM 2784]
MAGSIPFEIQIAGKGGHGSAPENAIDPIYAAVQIYQALQSVKMREISAQEPMVMTIGEFAFGKTCNVIPQSGQMSGTIRFFKKEVGAYAIQRIEEIVTALAAALRVEATFITGVFLPPVINDASLTQKLLPSIQAELGEDKVRDYQHKFMSSEDFAFYGEAVPVLYLNMGAGSKAAGYDCSLHHPKVEFDENAMKFGVAALVSAALGFLEV